MSSPPGPLKKEAIQSRAMKVFSMPSVDDHLAKLSDRLSNVRRVAAADLPALAHGLARYREPSHGRSVVEVLITVVPFVDDRGATEQPSFRAIYNFVRQFSHDRA